MTAEELMRRLDIIQKMKAIQIQYSTAPDVPRSSVKRIWQEPQAAGRLRQTAKNTG